MTKVYVASSWRNKHYPEVVKQLKSHGFDVYDFRNPPDGKGGFFWKDIDPNWEDWSTRDYIDQLHHPWSEYGFKRDIDAVKEGANEAQENESFCWFILGSLYLNGKPDLPKDIISAKYWIKKAVDAGNKEAGFIYELNWGDNPSGFKEYMMDKIEKDYDRTQKLKRWLPIVLTLIVVGLIIWILV